MVDLPAAVQVVIVGGGVMGASAAYHLAQRGCTDVLLLERAPFFGLGATGKCAGGIRYQFSTPINIQLSQLSLPMLDRFEAELGQAIDLRRCGYLFLLTRPADVVAFEQHMALQHRLGVATQWLSGAEVRRWLPQLAAADVLAATFHDRDGLADPHGVVAGYIQQARRRGVRALTGVALTGVQVEGGRVRGVETPQGRVACELLINAAGPWSAAVSALVGVPLPVQPVRRQMLTTTPLPAIPPDFPFVIDFAQSLYFHREGEGLLTGMSNPDQPPGFDETVDEAWELVHLEAAIRRLPLLASAGRLAHWAGLYEMTPDAHPIISRVPQVEGYIVVTGFSGHGFMHGPIAGLLTAELALDGRASSLDIDSLSYQRFVSAEGGRREHNVI